MIRYDGEEITPGTKLSHDANIYELIFEDFTTYDNGDKLPGIWVTSAVYDSDNHYLGHTYTMPYTGADDPDGEEALFYGGCLYDDGMRLTAPEHAKARLDCFKAAELLYRHAAGKGNAMAYLCLGYVYYYDRCKGNYWRNLDELETDEDYRRPFPREERAFECFEKATDAGLAEAFYKLGDAYKNGVGCEVDVQQAYRCYATAATVTDPQAPYLAGSIALRLAECLEEGIGCEHDFERALEEYERAESYLDLAVRSGDWYYKRARDSARDGVARCEQELGMERGSVEKKRERHNPEDSPCLLVHRALL